MKAFLCVFLFFISYSPSLYSSWDFFSLCNFGVYKVSKMPLGIVPQSNFSFLSTKIKNVVCGWFSFLNDHTTILTKSHANAQFKSFTEDQCKKFQGLGALLTTNIKIDNAILRTKMTKQQKEVEAHAQLTADIQQDLSTLLQLNTTRRTKTAERLAQFNTILTEKSKQSCKQSLNAEIIQYGNKATISKLQLDYSQLEQKNLQMTNDLAHAQASTEALRPLVIEQKERINALGRALLESFCKHHVLQIKYNSQEEDVINIGKRLNKIMMQLQMTSGVIKKEQPTIVESSSNKALDQALNLIRRFDRSPQEAFLYKKSNNGITDILSKHRG